MARKLSDDDDDEEDGCFWVAVMAVGVPVSVMFLFLFQIKINFFLTRSNDYKYYKCSLDGLFLDGLLTSLPLCVFFTSKNESCKRWLRRRLCLWLYYTLITLI